MARRTHHRSLVQTIPPYAEPVTLADAKLHSRVDITDDDREFTRIVAGARERAEAETRRQLVAATWEMTLDRFPGTAGYEGAENYVRDGDGWDGMIYGEIELPHGPLVAVNSVKYVDTNQVLQTLDPTQYQVDATAIPGRLRPAYALVWPIALWRMSVVTINYTTGYAAPFTASVSGDTITVKGRTYTSGDRIRLTGDQLPSPLEEMTDYFVLSTGATFQLSLTSGGSAINLTDAGNGTNFVGLIPPKILHGIRLLVGHWYEQRETTTDAGLSEISAGADALFASAWTGEL